MYPFLTTRKPNVESIKFLGFDVLFFSAHLASPAATLMTSEQAETQSNHSVKEPKDSYHLEEVFSNDDKKSGMNYDRVDPEIAKYASDKVIHIDDETNKRLKRLIDRRVLVIIVFTYFLQALDKGTLAFSSIMNLPKDAGLVGQQVT
jgi:hypothetical protein